uniref:CUB domain-containing protein n=3 Tax=Ciona intestinalis TaxID=7719 RepID=F6WNF9_CIOIN
MRLTLRIFCILVFCVVLVNTQQRRNNNRNRNNRVTPAPTVGGRWRPSVVTRRRPIASGNNRGGSGNRRPSTVQRRPLEPSELITPPSRRLPGEAPLQEPSWVHCMNNMEITNSWAMISNRGYPEAIVGQMQCSWIFFSARNTRIRISFYDIDLQPGEAGRCGTQFVDVIDLQLQKSQGRFCGDQIPGDYVSMSNSLRLDIQGDTTIISHRGFRAFVRSEPLTVQAGLRQRSLKFHGRITTTRRPTTTQRPIIRRTPTPNNRVRQPIRTRAPPTYQRPGQNIYGPNRQPQIIDDTSPPSSPSVGIYVLIGLLCVMIVLMGLAFLFRKRLRKRYDEFRGKE